MIKKTNMGVISVTLTYLLVSCVSAYIPCTSVDQGPYLGTKPTLLMVLDEADASELEASSVADDLKYHTELRLQGKAGEDFTVSMTSDSSVVDLQAYLDVVHKDGLNYVKLIKETDRDGPTTSVNDDINIISFLLTCIPANTSETPQIYNARLLINDVNDNDPLISSVNPVTISEMTPVNSVITSLTASDKDLNVEGPLQFSLDEDFGVFSISNKTGEIILIAPFDFDKVRDREFLDLKVTVKDRGPNTIRSSTAVVRMNIAKTSDHSSQFTYDGCVAYDGQCVWAVFTATGRNYAKGEVLTFAPSSSTLPETTFITVNNYDIDPLTEFEFEIVSSTPKGLADSFHVTTTKSENGYVATISAAADVTVTKDVKLFLAAKEKGQQKISTVALIRFDYSEKSISNTQNGLDERRDAESDYTDSEIALIIATCVLASFLVCVVVALVYICRRRGAKKQTGHSMEVYSNNGFRNEQ